MWYLYIITNVVNKKIYIGQTVSPKVRWSRHKSDAKYNKGNLHLSNSIIKYGVQNFNFDIIAQCKTLEDSDETEKWLIKHHNATNKDIGYNKSPGGQGKRPMSYETKQKLSASLKGKPSHMKGKHHTKETKDLLSSLLKGRPGTMTGKHHTKETKDLLSEINTGNKPDRANLEKRSKSMIGKNLGETNGMFGRTGENHPNAKLTQIQANKIRKEYSYGWLSYADLAKKFGVQKKTVLLIINNKLYTDI
jgi:group I intron endonuclease